MRIIIFGTVKTILLLTTITVAAQVTQVRTLSKTEVLKIFTLDIKTSLGIDYEIIKVYEYGDNTGKYYTILTEENKIQNTSTDTIHHNIKAFNLKRSVGLQKNWEIKDFIIKQTVGNGDEKSIRFWTKYFQIRDIDGDGTFENVLVYGTRGGNEYDDGRLKIILFHRGQKVEIRHQNGVLDSERRTQVDKSFYLLPSSIQKQIKDIMKEIAGNDQAIFPYGWLEAMYDKKTEFDETH